MEPAVGLPRTARCQQLPIVYSLCFLAIVVDSLSSQDGQAVIVQQLNNDVDTATSPTGNPERLTLSLTLPTEASPLLLNLTRNQFIDDKTPIFVAASGSVQRWSAAREKSFAVYQDSNNMASVLLQRQIVSDGRVVNIYQGTFHFGIYDYILRPSSSFDSNKRHRRASGMTERNFDEVQHVAYKATQQSFEAWSTEESFTSFDQPNYNEWAKYMASTSAEYRQYMTELLIVVDYAIYNSWFRLSRERSSVNKVNDALNGIRYYYTQIANGIDLRYSSIKEQDFGISIRLAGIYIATTPADSPWTERAGIKQHIDGVAHTDASVALTDFEHWAFNSTLNLNLPPFDQATLFTGNILKNGEYDDGLPARIAGLGNIAALCTKRSATVCQEWNEYASTGTATHELGHNFGSFHDGQKNGCSSSDQYIMAKAPTQLKPENFLNPFKFSRCSINYFRTYLNKLNQRKINCLLTSAPINRTLTDQVLTLPPGQFISVDQQCQHMYGHASYYCGGADKDKVMCETMLCYDISLKKCVTRTEQRAANGTTCGNHKWCMMGKCTSDPRAPAADDYCVSGDSKVPFGDGMKCDAKISTDPSLCYLHYNATCCYSCQSVRQLLTEDCPYRDHDKRYCSRLETRDCYDETVRKTCCSTCQRKRYFRTGCEFGDRAAWCSTIDGSQCYAGNTSKTCCETCRAMTAVGFPGCEYGDKAAWCKSYRKEQCVEQSVNQSCCLTCSRSKSSKPADDNCRDTQTWCRILPRNYCYNNVKSCCKTCKAYDTLIPGCEYGDRYKWCNSSLVGQCKDTTTLIDCCFTCYKLTGVTRTTTPKSNAISVKPIVDVTMLIAFTAHFISFALRTSMRSILSLHS